MRAIITIIGEDEKAICGGFLYTHYVAVTLKSCVENKGLIRVIINNNVHGFLLMYGIKLAFENFVAINVSNSTRNWKTIFKYFQIRTFV